MTEFEEKVIVQLKLIFFTLCFMIGVIITK